MHRRRFLAWAGSVWASGAFAQTQRRARIGVLSSLLRYSIGPLRRYAKGGFAKKPSESLTVLRVSVACLRRLP